MAECDVILTPLEPDFLGMQGFNRLLQTMKKHGAPWSRLRILICRYVDRLAIHREVRERLGQLFASGTLLPVVIRNSVRLAEAPGFGRHIFDHAPESTGAERLRGGGEAVAGGMARDGERPGRGACSVAASRRRRGVMTTRNRSGQAPPGGRLPNDPWIGSRILRRLKSRRPRRWNN